MMNARNALAQCLDAAAAANKDLCSGADRNGRIGELLGDFGGNLGVLGGPESVGKNVLWEHTCAAVQSLLIKKPGDLLSNKVKRLRRISEGFWNEISATLDVGSYGGVTMLGSFWG